MRLVWVAEFIHRHLERLQECRIKCHGNHLYELLLLP